MKKIKLVNKDLFLLVDDEDFDFLSQYRWYSQVGKGTFYAHTKIDNKWVYVHRLLAKTPIGMFTDHIDGNGLNNCKSNLRIVSVRENNLNRKMNVNSQHKYKGVWKINGKQRWIAVIYALNRKRATYLGTFNDEIDAAKAYDVAAKKYFGEFAKLNLE